MFRRSPYYNETRHFVFNDQNYDITNDLQQMKLDTSKDSSNQKKSVSKQEFIQYFNQKGQKQDMIDEIIKNCKYCKQDITINETKCQECYGVICQNCSRICTYCSEINCVICSNIVYLSKGDLQVCTQCFHQ